MRRWREHHEAHERREGSIASREVMAGTPHQNTEIGDGRSDAKSGHSDRQSVAKKL
jgi:hypothetical protein